MLSHLIFPNVLLEKSQMGAMIYFFLIYFILFFPVVSGQVLFYFGIPQSFLPIFLS